MVPRMCVVVCCVYVLCSTVHQNVYMDQAAAINAAAAFFSNTAPDGTPEPLPDGVRALEQVLPVAVEEGDLFCVSEILASGACQGEAHAVHAGRGQRALSVIGDLFFP